MDRNDLEFYITANNETYIHLDMKLYVWGKLISGSGKDMDASDHTAVINNIFHSLFIQGNVALNGVTMSQASKQYNYSSYIETLLT